MYGKLTFERRLRFERTSREKNIAKSSAERVDANHGHSEASEQLFILGLRKELPSRQLDPVGEGPSRRRRGVGVRRVRRQNCLGEEGCRFEDVVGAVCDLEVANKVSAVCNLSSQRSATHESGEAVGVGVGELIATSGEEIRSTLSYEVIRSRTHLLSCSTLFPVSRTMEQRLLANVSTSVSMKMW